MLDDRKSFTFAPEELCLDDAHYILVREVAAVRRPGVPLPWAIKKLRHVLPTLSAWKSRVCACMCVRKDGDVEWRITFNIFMHGIYSNIPETNHLSRVAVLRLQRLVSITPYPFAFILPLFRSTCPVPSTAVLGTSSSSCLRRQWRSCCFCCSYCCCCCCCWDLLVGYNIQLW